MRAIGQIMSFITRNSIWRLWTSFCKTTLSDWPLKCRFTFLYRRKFDMVYLGAQKLFKFLQELESLGFKLHVADAAH
ncbi:hypothetical protein L596_013770 [Steinernema carpocapsae]|uniref:Uncharacterized protein n=1 Tax=Steinernema carpocapsae TaxID=34508 RepID=A0A4U5P165_STECR|nr:hypothetical protein L596_013770 [Steinernema carpocapsae]